jgi:hypothetical protein
LKLESLSPADIDSAVVQFARAVELDPTFAGGYVGLATAKFWKYESTRSGFQPDTGLLAAAVRDARQAVALAPAFAEAHATLSYLLTASGRFDEAHAAARRAVALQPEWWAHHFRLGHATWGASRLRALGQCLELYPEFAFAHYEMAMVHVARQAFDVAGNVLREGMAIQERVGTQERRFPANGLHWMLGAIALRQGDTAVAVAECDRELTSGARRCTRGNLRSPPSIRAASRCSPTRRSIARPKRFAIRSRRPMNKSAPTSALHSSPASVGTVTNRPVSANRRDVVSHASLTEDGRPKG